MTRRRGWERASMALGRFGVHPRRSTNSFFALALNVPNVGKRLHVMQIFELAAIRNS